MNSIFNESTWNKYLRGYTIHDCAIFREHGFFLVLIEEKENRDLLPRTRLLSVMYDKPITVGSLPMVEVGDFNFCTVVRGTSPAEYVAVDTRSNVYSGSAQRNNTERAIDEVIDMRTHQNGVGVVRKMVRAAGQVFALGSYRKIYRRIGVEQWIELGSEGKGVPMPPDIETRSSYFMSMGFRDMSAFSPDDMYAVGGDGDAWRFDGKTWHDCRLPTKAPLYTVCCAGDGQVYITELNGSVWAGREGKWTRVATSDIAAGFQPVDSAWFNDRLYLGGQEGVWLIDAEHKTLVPLADTESDAPNATNSGRLDVTPDGKFLLTAGPYGACLHDGAGWKRLFSAFDFL
ncbi:hypothetical protein [Massilia rubra]|uniref:WD40 repeat domain-containing protein n=1 Tax=Massilia rubra TaxID=2607910 RepID=A0ABX0M0G1_9BURK|nr:hypothetical protein [Massilia rubra]NHZ35781.1 hypothetical protein [Massilia rubra]